MTRLVVILGFFVAFGAGLAVGLKHRHEPCNQPTTRPAQEGGWLTAELRLTPEQRDQMKKIWSGMASSGRQREERRRELARERDAAIAALVRPEDKGRHDAALKDYADKVAALDRERRESFSSAVERTKQILTPEQREKYEELLKRHQWDRSKDSHRSGRGHDKRNDQPGSKPASAPAPNAK